MIEDIDKIYQQTILEYNKRSDLKKEIDKPTYVERGHNPSCGDDLTLLIKIKDDKILDASFIGSGCAISTASTAMLIEDIKGKTLVDAKKIIVNFFLMMKDHKDGDVSLLNDAVLMEYVRDMPARVKCALLAWHTLEDMLDKNINTGNGNIDCCH